MRIGVLMLPTDPWPETVARARHLEALGYDHLWTYDHLSWRRYRDRPWHATIPWLTGLAAATSSIRLGTMVASPNFRHPVTLAKDVMTLDHISQGRLTLGVGAGGVGFDSTVLGGEVLAPAARGQRLAEFVELLDLLLRQPTTSFRGTYYSAVEARMLPGCLQRPRPPLAVAAGDPASMALVARFADAWITYGDSSHRDSPSPGPMPPSPGKSTLWTSTATVSAATRVHRPYLPERQYRRETTGQPGRLHRPRRSVSGPRLHRHRLPPPPSRRSGLERSRGHRRGHRL